MELTREHIHRAALVGACIEVLEQLVPGMLVTDLSPGELAWAAERGLVPGDIAARINPNDTPEQKELICEMIDVDVPGMSLRDWFAGQALVGFLASPSNVDALKKSAGEDFMEALGGICYEFADALLAARERDR